MSFTWDVLASSKNSRKSYIFYITLLLVKVKLCYVFMSFTWEVYIHINWIKLYVYSAMSFILRNCEESQIYGKYVGNIWEIQNEGNLPELNRELKQSFSGSVAPVLIWRKLMGNQI